MDEPAGAPREGAPDEKSDSKRLTLTHLRRERRATSPSARVALLWVGIAGAGTVIAAGLAWYFAGVSFPASELRARAAAATATATDARSLLSGGMPMRAAQKREELHAAISSQSELVEQLSNRRLPFAGIAASMAAERAGFELVRQLQEELQQEATKFEADFAEKLAQFYARFANGLIGDAPYALTELESLAKDHPSTTLARRDLEEYQRLADRMDFVMRQCDDYCKNADTQSAVMALQEWTDLARQWDELHTAVKVVPLVPWRDRRSINHGRVEERMERLRRAQAEFERCLSGVSEANLQVAYIELLDVQGTGPWAEDAEKRRDAWMRAREAASESASSFEAEDGTTASGGPEPSTSTTLPTLVNPMPIETWADVLVDKVDPSIVADARLAKAIAALGLPWRVRHRATGIEMVLVPPGEYARGASLGDIQARDGEGPRHEVAILNAFYLGVTEVTQDQWMALMGANPSYFKGGKLPVEGVTWDQVMEFLAAFAGPSELRLPTEAEWEYACRAGTETVRYGKLDDIAWYANNAGKELIDASGLLIGSGESYTDSLLKKGHSTHAVGLKVPNALGLHDMLGNVYEWCSDWFGAYPVVDRYSDPTGPASGSTKICRGGSWWAFDWGCRASARVGRDPNMRYSDLGFRVARSASSISVAGQSNSATSEAPNGKTVNQETKPKRSLRSLEWAEIVRADPDPAIVRDGALQARLRATELPWCVVDRATGIKMVLIPSGRYQRGASPRDTKARGDESPVHSVTIARAFYLGMHEVTQSQWRALMSSNPSTNGPGVLYPVDSVSFLEVEQYLSKARGLRLPTEAEWEYACRAGSTGARHGALDDIAWHGANSEGNTHQVGTKLPNAFGLHDMLGNVAEFCSDWYARYPLKSISFAGPSTGSTRVVRGGAYNSSYIECRASFRTSISVDVGRSLVGFRVAREP